MRVFHKNLAAAFLAGLLGAATVAAQETPGTCVALELNALEPVPQGCWTSFLIRNWHGVDIDIDIDIDKAVYEAGLSDTEDRVDRMTLFDFDARPAGRPRVRRFVVAGFGRHEALQVAIAARDARDRAAAPRKRAQLSGSGVCHGLRRPG